MEAVQEAIGRGEDRKDLLLGDGGEVNEGPAADKRDDDVRGDDMAVALGSEAECCLGSIMGGESM